MINPSFINEWNYDHPWISPAMVEQDLIISRVLVAIFSDAWLSEQMAFCGGTALHKLHFSPPARYSEDIDLVQIEPGPMRKTMDHLREALSFLGEPSTKRSTLGHRLIYRFETGIRPFMPMRLKVEINCREHFHTLPDVHIPFHVKNSWFTGEALVHTYQLDELLGTKLRALYQRKKGRDLFDVDYALNHATINPHAVLLSFCQYMKGSASSIPTEREFLLNMDEKMKDESFLNDTRPILRPSIDFSPTQAYERVKERLLSRLDEARAEWDRSQLP